LRFSPPTGSEKADSITCLAICPNKKFLAVAEKSQDSPLVHIYNTRTLRKFKNLRHDKVNAKEVISMNFSADGTVLLTLTSGPSHTLTLWNWNKAKALSSIQVSESSPCTGGSFSIVDAGIVAVTGNEIFKFYRVGEGELRPMPSSNLEGVNVISHVWLNQPEDHLVLGTDDGELIVYNRSDEVCKIKQSPKGIRNSNRSVLSLSAEGGSGGSGVGGGVGTTAVLHNIIDEGDSDSPLRVESLVALNRGFIAGCSNAIFRFYSLAAEAPEDAQLMFTLTTTWQIPNNPADVMTMALSPNEDTLCATLNNNQLFSVNLSSPTSIKNDDMKPVSSLNHGPGAITGLDICIRKPLVVTSGMDRTVRVWNYVDMKLEMSKTFTEDPCSVAFHPSGLHVLIGFADKLRLMNLLMDDIRPYREVSIKWCRECKFSNGGQYFAAVNGNVICVYDFYNGEKVVDMRGHNSKVKGLSWGADDSTLISCGQDGAIYQWNVEKGTRVGEFVSKGTMYNCAVGNSEMVWSVGTDKILKEMELPDYSGSSNSLNVVKELETGVTLGQIVLSHSEHIMFAGTCAEKKPGVVRAYSFPLTGDYLEYPCMGGPISRMRITHNDQHLFVTDESGCLCIFSVKDKQEKRSLTGKDSSSSMHAWSEEILVTKSDLEEKQSLMQELKNKVDELALHNEYQMRLKDMNYSEKIKEVTEKFTQDLEQDKNKFELLREEKNDMEMEYEERLKQMDEKHQHELQELEGSYQQKIMAEVERYQTLVHERDLQRDRWEEQQGLLINTHEKYVGELTEDFEQKLDEDKQLRMTLEDEKQELNKEFEEIKVQLEDDIDTEIQSMRSKYDQQLAAEREATLRYKGENGIMRKKFSVLQKEIEDQKEEIKLLLEKEKDLHEQIKALEREIQAHKREIKNRDDTIGEKEKKIYELKKKNQELEKFKFVLDYKIKELKRQIEPRETEISNMKGQIKEMDRELEQFHKSNAQLDVMIGELRSKLDSMQGDILRQRKTIGDQESLIRRCKSELHECAQVIQHPTALSEKVSMLYQQHVQSELPKNEVDVNVQSEYARHQQYLEQTLKTLKKKFNHDVKVHKQQNLKLMEENINIIQEISSQREGNKQTKQLLQQKIGELNRLKRKGERKRAGQTPITPSPRLSSANTGGLGGGLLEDEEEELKVISSNRQRIADLRAQIKEMEGQIISSRPFSREILPPVN